MQSITLPRFPDLQIRKPDCWGSLVDLTLCWPNNTEDPRAAPRYARCCAGAIGIVIDDERLRLPVYQVETMEMVAYGLSVLEALITRGVPLSNIIRVGREVADWLAASLPSEAEVAKTADFIEGEEPAI